VNPQAIILTGSPTSYVNHPKAKRLDTALYQFPAPMLGICYGMQRMVVDLGGKVKRMGMVEKGETATKLLNPSVLFRDFADEAALVWMSHGSKVTTLPKGFEPIAATKTCLAAIECPAR